MLVPEFAMHPEWSTWSKETGRLTIRDDAPEEAKKFYQEYLDFLKYCDDNEIDFQHPTIELSAIFILKLSLA